MAVITPSTFDPLKARCNVRLQQGVPIVDADWNELDDIRKFQLRSYLRWFVGDGIPNDGAAFRIDAITSAVKDNFTIRFGDTAPPDGTSNFDQAMRYAGRAIVDGMDIMITSDVKYKDQPLFSAAALGVPIIAAMPATADVAVYLDVWERLVTAQEDTSLVLGGIGTESCSRVKREWCVRTRAGKLAPKASDSDFIADHAYYLLAVVTRADPNANILPSHISDQRHVRLSLASVEQRLATMERLLAPRFAPSPNQFDPKLGPVGREVNLLGSNFAIGATEVRFSFADIVPIEQIAQIVGTPSPTKVTIKVPSVQPGPWQIIVKTDAGMVLSNDTFTVVP
jgi:hypothetical protein